MATLAQEFSFQSFLIQPECGRSILLVEDDRFVRSAAGELLRGWGWEVLEAQNAATAQDIFCRHAARVHALVCDVILPDGSGVELCRRLQRESPALRVILTSGYSMSPSSYALETESSHFLKKPFSGELLSTALRKIFADQFLSDEPSLPRTIADSLQNLPG